MVCCYPSLLRLPQPMWTPKWEICSTCHQRIAVLNKQFGRQLTEIGLATSTVQSLNFLFFKSRIRHNSPGNCHCSAQLNHNTALSRTWAVTSLSMFVVEVLPYYDIILNISYVVSGFVLGQILLVQLHHNTDLGITYTAMGSGPGRCATMALTQHCPEYNLHSEGCSPGRSSSSASTWHSPEYNLHSDRFWSWSLFKFGFNTTHPSLSITYTVMGSGPGRCSSLASTWHTPPWV